MKRNLQAAQPPNFGQQGDLEVLHRGTTLAGGHDHHRVIVGIRQVAVVRIGGGETIVARADRPVRCPHSGGHVLPPVGVAAGMPEGHFHCGQCIEPGGGQVLLFAQAAALHPADHQRPQGQHRDDQRGGQHHDQNGALSPVGAAV